MPIAKKSVKSSKFAANINPSHVDTFRTVFKIPEAPFQISPQDGLMLIGSCFTEHIGQYLIERKFSAAINPFGIVFNPISIAQCIKRLFGENQYFSPEELFENQGLWRSWTHHGQFARPSREEACQVINEAYRQSAVQLRQTTRLLLTLGSATVFYLKESGEIVANNHKMPAGLFEQRRLTVAEVTDTLSECLHLLWSRQPDLAVALSVSPVRHLRAGMVEHQRSKAVLLLACDELCRRFPQLYYFPAYELLMDDLRDYRFYQPDMVHPAPVAIDYIWEKFSGAFFSVETRERNQMIEKILATLKHRPIHPPTPAYEAMIAAQRAALEKF